MEGIMPKQGENRTRKRLTLTPKFPFVETCLVKEVYEVKISDRGLHYGEWVPYDPAKHGKRKSRVPAGYHRATGR